MSFWKRNKNKKQYDDDDGRTIANMNVEGMPWYEPNKEEKDKKKQQMEDLRITRKERRAMIWGAYLAYLPMLLVMLAGFGIAVLLIMLWLS
ncbi:MAG: hypothetical protein IKC48_04050 [Clostridia bacterium]|nr:hypothetical protein [Clostridia bacterium]